MADLISVGIYWSALAAALVLSVVYTRMCEKIDNRYIDFLWIVGICLPLSLVAGLRNDVGTDYHNYVRIINQVKELSLLECLTHPYMDILFAAFLRVMLYLTSNEKMIFFIISLAMQVMAVGAVAKYRKKISLPLFVLLYYLIVFHPSLNVARQCFAFSFLLWGTTLALERKYFKCLVVFLLGMLVHNTVILGLGFLVVVWYLHLPKFQIGSIVIDDDWKRWIYYGLLAISPLLIPIVLQMFVTIPFFEGYAKYVIQDADVGFGQVAYMILLTTPMVLMWKRIAKDKTLYALFHVALLYFPVAYVGYYFNWASRLNIYTMMIFATLACMVVNKRPNHVSSRIFAGWYTLLFGCQYVLDILVNNYHETFPYMI